MIGVAQRFLGPMCVVAGVASGLVLLPDAATALTADFRTCLAKARSEPANADCARKEAGRQAARLKAIWSKVQAGSKKGRDGQHAALLEDAQKKWLAFRQQHCRFMASRAISGYSQAYWGARCQARLTEQRITDMTLRLKAYQR
jgi:uncharacterized protein YecT (DUF1311 family)